MSAQKPIISPAQFFTLLFVSSAFSIQLRVFLPAYGDFSPVDYMCGTLICFVFVLLAVIPTAVLLKKCPAPLGHGSPLPALRPVFGIVFLLYAADTLSHYVFFLRSSLYPETSRIITAIAIMLAVFTLTVNGLQPLARIGGIFAVMFLLLFAVVIVIYSKGITLQKLTVPAAEGFERIIRYAFIQLRGFGELTLLMWVYGKSGFSFKKAIPVFAASVALTSILCILTVVLPLGAAANMYFFPFYSGLQNSAASMQRMDVIYLIIWTLLALARISVFFLAGCELLATPKLARKPMPRILIAAVITAAALVGANYYHIFTAQRLLIDGGLFFWPLMAAPLIGLISLRKRGAR